MKDTRLYKRIPCDGQGDLVVGTEKLLVTATNLSKGGVCMRLAETEWQRLRLDALDTVSGCLSVDGCDFSFKGRICWSHTSDGRVFFGLEFLEHDKHIIDSVLEQLSVLDDPPPMGSFQI